MALKVNGEAHELLVQPQKTLLEVLREDLALTGTKHGCELGECGTCTVLIDDEPVLSCLALALDVQGAAIETVEGLRGAAGHHELQIAFAELGAAQCGYCTPGILMASKALLAENPRPTQSETSAWLAGNLCRCTGYIKILEAVELAADRIETRRSAGEENATHRQRRRAAAPPDEAELIPIEGERGTPREIR